MGTSGDGIADAAETMPAAIPPGDPRRVTIEDITAMLEAAWEGADPR
jgi:maleylacetate reductase